MRRVYIIANGEPDLPREQQLFADDVDLVICADGGANYLEQLAFIKKKSPSLMVVGDLDSASPAVIQDLEKQGATIRRHRKEKDASDLELALVEAVNAGPPEELVLIAVLGGRPDHQLTNITLLGRYAEQEMKVTLLGESWKAQYVTAKQPANFLGKKHDLVSLVPMSKTVEGVTAGGLKWPLRDAHLTWGSSLTLSNEFEDESVSIVLDGGLLLAFHFH